MNKNLSDTCVQKTNLINEMIENTNGSPKSKFKNEKERFLWADVLRGFLILLVILGHVLQHGDFQNNTLWNIIYSFHMAAFFTISGFVNYRSNRSSNIIIKRAKQLLVPFFSWTLLRLIVHGNFNLTNAINMFLYPDRSFWFIFVLFFIILAFYFFQSIAQKLRINEDYTLLGGCILFVLAMVVSEFRFLGFQFISFYFGFYTLGWILHKFDITLNRTLTLITGFMWLILAFFWKMHEVPSPLKGIQFIPDSLIIYSYRYLTAIMGSIFVIMISKHFINNNKNNSVFNALSYFGKISLGIYIIHLFIGSFIDPFLLNLLGTTDTSITYIVIDFIVKLITSLIIIKFIERIKPLNAMLLGKF